MTVPNTFSLDTIVDVVVEVSPLAAPRPTFNQMLIMGSSNHIAAANRVAMVESMAEVSALGYTANEAEYIAAGIYFSQQPAPNKLWLGRWDESGNETALQAFTACRLASFDWYVGSCVSANANKAIHANLAAYTEAATPTTIYAYTTGDNDVLAGSNNSIGDTLKTLEYSRTIGQYSTAQANNAYPNNIYAINAIMGYAMGQNTQLLNSAYTLKFKREIGIAAEPLTSNQVTAIEGKNVNLYLNYGSYYNIFEQGVMADGSFFDEKINLDMLSSDIQLNVMDLLYENPKVPQTDAGVTQIIHAINQACDSAVNRGFIGPGTWTGSEIYNLKYGDSLPKGYLVQAATLASQSDADRQARKSPSIYVAIKEAGAIHSVLIGVSINR